MQKLKDILHELVEDESTFEFLKNSTLISATGFYGKNEELEKWEIIFYDPIENKAYKIEVDKDDNYVMYESELLDEKFKEVFFDLTTDFIDEEEALKKGFEYYMKNYENKNIISMFLLLNVIDKIWHINLVTDTLSVIQINIGIYDKEIKGSKEVSLVHVESS